MGDHEFFRVKAIAYSIFSEAINLMGRFLKFIILVACLGGFIALNPLIASSQQQPSPQLEVVAELSQAPGNITLTPDNRTMISLHQFYSPELRVAEVADSGELMPFPNATWSRGGQEERLALDTVLGIQSDPRGVVWMLDNGMRGNATPKLVAWDTRGDRLARIIHLPPPITPDNAFVNDLAVDLEHNAIYIADPAGGDNAALIVVDLPTGKARRVLQGHESVVPEEIDLIIDGDPVEIKQPDGTVIRPHVGVNPIALDARREWLYFGPMHAESLYRVRTADLRNEALSEAALGERVERYSDKPICDGISIDRQGNIYLGELAANAIGVITPNRRYQRLVQDDELLSWVDAFSFGPDERLYTVSNQLHRTAALNAGESEAEPPFYILRLNPLAPGITGR